MHPVNIDVSDPTWKEAFLMPAEAHGTVVQLAESHGYPETRAALLEHVAEQRAQPAPALVERSRHPPRASRARLRRVVLRTPDLAGGGRSSSAGMLEGEVERESDRRVDLVWPRGAASRSSCIPARRRVSTASRSKGSHTRSP